MTPEEYATRVANEFVRQWKQLGIGVDHFIRTSSPEHFEVVRDLFARCLKNGHIYKGSYTGQYCFHDELYVNDAKPGDPCPDCGRPTETVTEENYFFRLSAFQDRLLELYEKQPDFIRPDYRRNELIAFVKGGLTTFPSPAPASMGHSGAGGRPSCFLRLVRRAHFLHFRGEEPGGDVAGRSAPDCQGYSSISRHLLAGFPDGRRSAAAEAGVRARLAAVRREQDEQIARQRVRPGPIAESDGRRRVALFPVARDHLRTGRQFSATTR